MGADPKSRAGHDALASLRAAPVAPTQRAGRRRALVAGGVAVVVALGAGWSARVPKMPERTPAPPLVVASAAVEPALQATGYVTARRRATLSAPVQGELVAIDVEVGDEVERGQILARIDDAGVRAQRELARAELAAAHSALSETEVRLFEARDELERHTRLAGAGVLSRAAQTRALSEVDAQRARLEHQRDSIEVALRRLGYWRQEVARRSVRAPFGGVVVSVDAEVGEGVAPTADAPRFARVGLLTLVDMDSLEVETDVNETQIAALMVGQYAEVTLDAYPDDPLSARVAALLPVADRRRATVRVRVAFLRGDPRLRPEMGVRVAFGGRALWEAK